MVFLVISKESSKTIYTDDDPEIELESFETKQEAEYYLETGNRYEPSNINVFTDGACSNNGKSNANAGIGVYISDNNSKNVSRSIKGKQTNNTAELLAVIEVFSIFVNNENITIYTDSEYVIKCAGTYGEKCEKSGYKNKKGNVPNHELVKQIYELFKQNKNFNIKHVKAHTENTDLLSNGNREADRLANLAIGVEECPYQSNIENIINASEKHYVNVSYSQKDIAKELGCKWDKSQKKWYYLSEISIGNKDEITRLFT
jgi:ribonuclease HI